MGCKNRKAKKPLNKQATSAANKAQPSCSNYAERKKWMDAYIAAGGAWECADPKEKTPEDTCVPCKKKKKSISGKFKQPEVKCGDLAHVEADGVNISEGANTTFKIYRKRDNKTLTTVTGPMRGQKVRDLEWKPKRPEDHNKDDKYVFDVSADGVSAKSSNEFKFLHFPDYASETKTINCNSGIYGWTGKFDISYANNEVTVTVKIKLLNRNGAKPASGSPLPAISGTVSDVDKTKIKNDIEAKLSKKMKMYRKACKFADGCICPKEIKIVVDFVESGMHHDVNLFTGSGRANATNWTRVKTRNNSYAHETGHLLGWYDEYTGGAVGSTPRWKANVPANVMNVGLTVPPEYGWDFRDWFKGKTSEDWNVK